MECKECGKTMLLEDYNTTFFNNDEEICLCEHFGCANCNLTATKWTYYKKDIERTVYHEMP